MLNFKFLIVMLDFHLVHRYKCKLCKSHLSSVLQSSLQGSVPGPRLIEVLLTAVPCCQQLSKQPTIGKKRKQCLTAKPEHVHTITGDAVVGLLISSLCSMSLAICSVKQ